MKSYQIWNELNQRWDDFWFVYAWKSMCHGQYTFTTKTETNSNSSAISNDLPPDNSSVIQFNSKPRNNLLLLLLLFIVRCYLNTYNCTIICTILASFMVHYFDPTMVKVKRRKQSSKTTKQQLIMSQKIPRANCNLPGKLIHRSHWKTLNYIGINWLLAVDTFMPE